MIGLRPAASRRSRSLQRFPVSGRAHGCTKVAVAVEPRRRHQSGETIELLQRRPAQRTGPARAGLGAIVEQVLGIEFVQSVQGERWPSAVSE